MILRWEKHDGIIEHEKAYNTAYFEMERVSKYPSSVLYIVRVQKFTFEKEKNGAEKKKIMQKYLMQG